VFQTTARNLFADDDPDPPGQIRVGGIFRRDLQTGALDVVAYGNLQPTTGPLIARGAQNPSVSADGRYVAFSTGWKLVPADTNPNVDIYVRDMTKPIGSADAYVLASARDGSATGASYGSTAMFAGAETTPGTSLSADGTKVLFRTGVTSDLPGAPGVTTPSGQLFVRELTTGKTTLVTRKMADGSPAGGALGQPATLSADGTTVVWPGLNASQQTRFLLHETPNDQISRYYLWRRIADGPDAPTRRITGAVDLDDPGCSPAEQDAWTDSPSASGPCYGPFSAAEGSFFGDISGLAPALSADGYRVAFLTSSFLRGLNGGIFLLDLYTTDMHPGVSRKDGTRQLTTHSLSLPDNTTNSSVSSVAISADGNRIAFTTARTSFIGQSLRFVGTPLQLPERVQLYVVDLARGEIQLVSRALDGSGGNGDVADLPSPNADGTKIAFVSAASNLFTGDANESADAFLAADSGDAASQERSQEPPFDGYSSPPAGSAAAGAPKLELSSRSRNGRVLLTVRVPGAGTISATARSPLGTIATKTARPARAGKTTIVLELKRRYLERLRRRHRISAQVTVRYTPPATGPSLSARLRVTFTR
jgi:Tol biopolymer transport system component